MPILKAHHYYVNKQPKKSVFINEIIPAEDTVVSQHLFDQYEDKTVEKIRIDDRSFGADVKKRILETTGADK